MNAIQKQVAEVWVNILREDSNFLIYIIHYTPRDPSLITNFCNEQLLMGAFLGRLLCNGWANYPILHLPTTQLPTRTLGHGWHDFHIKLDAECLLNIDIC